MSNASTTLIQFLGCNDESKSSCSSSASAGDAGDSKLDRLVSRFWHGTLIDACCFTALVFVKNTLPPLMLPSKACRIAFREAPLPSSTMTPPPAFLQLLATSSRTRSARPSSRHPEPQFFPTKDAKVCSADEDMVRLCFLVKVRKATGRRVEGGSKIGRTELLVGAGLGFAFRKGCTGVPNAGDDEKGGSESRRNS